MSNGDVNRLGERLRTSALVEPADLDLLQALRREYESAMFEVQSRITDELEGLAVPTSRLKTVQTLVGKLRREPHMKLAQVQDIAGVRVVRDMSLPEQDALARKIAARFDELKLIDRRAKPSHGYRAVHLVAKVDGLLVEIQVRTAMQDRWAQIVERMADYWGRQIRYGEAPDEAARPVGARDRSFVVDLVRRLSPLIESCERGRAARQLMLRGDFYCLEVSRVLAEIAKLPVLPSVS